MPKPAPASSPARREQPRFFLEYRLLGRHVKIPLETPSRKDIEQAERQLKTSKTVTAGATHGKGVHRQPSFTFRAAGLGLHPPKQRTHEFGKAPVTRPYRRTSDNDASCTLTVNSLHVHHLLAQDTALHSALSGTSGLLRFIQSQRNVSIDLVREVLVPSGPGAGRKQRSQWTRTVLGTAVMPMYQFKSAFVVRLDAYAPIGVQLGMSSLKATIGIERTRTGVELAPLLSTMTYCGGVYVPGTDFFASDPLPSEWLAALPDKLNMPSSSSSSSETEHSSDDDDNGYHSPAAPLSSARSSLSLSPSPRGAAGAGAGAGAGIAPAPTARPGRGHSSADEEESDAYGSDEFQDEEEEGEQGESPRKLAEIVEETATPRAADVEGTMWEVAVDVHSVQALRENEAQSCRVVYELMGMVQSMDTGKDAVPELEPPKDVLPLFSQLGIGCAVPEQEAGAAKMDSFAFNWTAKRRFVASPESLQAYLDEEKTLLFEVIRCTPAAEQKRASKADSPQASPKTQAFQEQMKLAGLALRESSSDSDDSEPEDKLNRYMCELDMTQLLARRELDGAVAVTNTDGSKLRLPFNPRRPHMSMTVRLTALRQVDEEHPLDRKLHAAGEMIADGVQAVEMEAMLMLMKEGTAAGFAARM